jgi:hypothetical protein
MRLFVLLQDAAVGMWQLRLRHSEDEDAENKAQYKFHRSLIIKAGQTCTVSQIYNQCKSVRCIITVKFHTPEFP